MLAQRLRGLKRSLAFLLGITTAVSPSAMLLGGGRGVHPVAAATHHHGHSAPRSHSHSGASGCCDLCLLACGSCPGLPGRQTIASSPVEMRAVAATTDAGGRLVALEPRRLPFSIGPPAFRIA